jgi:hypothetical protein
MVLKSRMLSVRGPGIGYGAWWNISFLALGSKSSQTDCGDIICSRNGIVPLPLTRDLFLLGRSFRASGLGVLCGAWRARRTCRARRTYNCVLVLEGEVS